MLCCILCTVLYTTYLVGKSHWERWKSDWLHGDKSPIANWTLYCMHNDAFQAVNCTSLGGFNFHQNLIKPEQKLGCESARQGGLPVQSNSASKCKEIKLRRPTVRCRQASNQDLLRYREEPIKCDWNHVFSDTEFTTGERTERFTFG